MSTEPTRNDDLPFHDHSTEHVEINGAQAPPATAKSSLLLKLWLVFALLLTLAWSAGLSWGVVRVALSLL